MAPSTVSWTASSPSIGSALRLGATGAGASTGERTGPIDTGMGPVLGMDIGGGGSGANGGIVAELRER